MYIPYGIYIPNIYAYICIMHEVNRANNVQRSIVVHLSTFFGVVGILN